MSDNDLVLRIPHTLGAAEARRRLDAGALSAKAQFAQVLREAETVWEDNRLNFRVTALAQTVRGVVEVEEQYVELRAQLPLLIRMLAKRFVPVVETTGQKLLK